MTQASFNADAVPRLVEALKLNEKRLTPLLPGVDQIVRKLSKPQYRSKLTVDIVFEIAKAKSSRRAALVLGNDPYLVEKITELAFALRDGQKAAQLLCVLDGVDLPTASAILSWVFPEKWPVIDVRAWQTLHSFGVVTSRESGRGLGMAQWRVYLQAVEALRSQLGDLAKTPQQVDRLLYAYDVLAKGDNRL